MITHLHLRWTQSENNIDAEQWEYYNIFLLLVEHYIFETILHIFDKFVYRLNIFLKQLVLRIVKKKSSTSHK